MEKLTNLNIRSSAIDQNTHHLKDENHAIKGGNSIHLQWDSVPTAKSYAIIITDYQAAGAVCAPFIHWVGLTKGNITSIPANLNQENAKKYLFPFENSTSKKIINSAVPSAFQTDNSTSYFGPFPPDSDHKYEIKVMALAKEYNDESLRKLLGNDKNEQSYGCLFELTKIIKDAGVIAYDVLTFIAKQSLPGDEKSGPKFANNNFQISGNFFNNKDRGHIQIEILTNLNDEQAKALKSQFDEKLQKFIVSDKPFEISLDASQAKNVKSYVVLVLDNSKTNSWAVQTINGVAYSIANNWDNKVQVNLNQKENDVNIKFGVNSYNQTKTAFVNIITQKINLKEIPDTNLILTDFDSKHKNHYTIIAFATNLDANDPKLAFEEEKPNIAQILKAIHSNVVGYGSKSFEF
ncbi:YbhB/YbcL family Raf kinase inhibitor-like protein [Mycoplasmopsis sturni]|uniref:hypothetical protein n=1 Tax=Mycoplasmopsis sturni TaxID=39047 RepID=UPI0005652E0C|nr:hypothetical protein [Mycoplasmopsis sturni]